MTYSTRVLAFLPLQEQIKRKPAAGQAHDTLAAVVFLRLSCKSLIAVLSLQPPRKLLTGVLFLKLPRSTLTQL